MSENGMPARRHRGPMGPGHGFVEKNKKLQLYDSVLKNLMY